MHGLLLFFGVLMFPLLAVAREDVADLQPTAVSRYCEAYVRMIDLRQEGSRRAYTVGAEQAFMAGMCAGIIEVYRDRMKATAARVRLYEESGACSPERSTYQVATRIAESRGIAGKKSALGAMDYRLLARLDGFRSVAEMVDWAYCGR